MKFENFFRKYYITFILILLVGYIFFAVLAPILMKFGLEKPARLMYWVYSNFCHQYPYRSWFLFGKQAYYPLLADNDPEILLFKDVFYSEKDARNILGNEKSGYKLAFCQRDLAIYMGLAISVVGFILLNKRISPIPLMVWVLLGVLPISIDGGLQLISDKNILFLPTWESTPLIRSVTGGLFGITSGLYILPTIETIIQRDI